METVNDTRNVNQIRELITKALELLGLLSDAAVELELGTWAVESNGGQYTHQLGGGPAHGMWQTEKPTFMDVVARCGKAHYQVLKDALDGNDPEDSFDALDSNHVFACMISRLKYFLSPGAIPEMLEGQAAYWKKYYNTSLGKGTVEEYIKKYNQFVAIA